MLKQTLSSKIILLAILLTAIALASFRFIPHKYLKLDPDAYPNANYFLLPANNDPEHKKVTWVGDKPFHFHCKFEPTDSYPPCNFIFMLSTDNQHGTDLSSFKTLEFDLKYKGPAKVIRVAFRQFDPRFSTPADPNSSKFLTLTLRTKDILGHEIISMDEFFVAEWWIDQFNLPRTLNRPDRNNVLNFSLDFLGDLNNTEHDLEITNIQFVGEWISREHWYLLILIVWLVGGALFTIGKLIYLQRRDAQQEAKITELVVRNSKLTRESDKFRKLSTVDALTNAFNRYGIEQIVEALNCQNENVSIVMFDIDHFKRINDKRGHDAGDRVLQKISDIVLTKTRTTDKLGRWGGEEFILICPNTSIGMATALAEKLRLLISDTQFESPNAILVTASFGVAKVHSSEDFSAAFKRADEALYKAKSLGRNCVIIADLDAPPLDDLPTA